MLADRLNQALHSLRIGNVIGVLPDQPGRPTLPQHAIEGLRYANVGLFDYSQPPIADRLQVRQTPICSTVDYGKNFKGVRRLSQQAIHRLLKKGHSVVNGQANCYQCLRVQGVLHNLIDRLRDLVV